MSDAQRVASGSEPRSVSFGVFRIELQTGWQYNVEDPAAAGFGDQVTIRHASGPGKLQMQAYQAPAAVGDEVLRNMTNVDSSIALTKRDWGDYSGYDYEYAEDGSYSRHWWLAHADTVLLITYQCPEDSRDRETRQVTDIVESLRIDLP